jgi:serine phosphatase RsbU (regulator of sigma subunit)
LAVADAAGTGPTAAGLGAAALGALRAARCSGLDLEQALGQMHETIRRLDNDEFFVPVWLARWRGATSTLTWVNCGHPAAFVVDDHGELEELEGPEHPPLGRGKADRSFEVARRQLNTGERLIVVTDGIMERQLEGGGKFGVEGIKDALARTERDTAAATAMAIQQAVTDCWNEPLEDDGTIVVMAIN